MLIEVIMPGRRQDRNCLLVRSSHYDGRSWECERIFPCTADLPLASQTLQRRRSFDSLSGRASGGVLVIERVHRGGTRDKRLTTPTTIKTPGLFDQTGLVPRVSDVCVEKVAIGGREGLSIRREKIRT